MKTINKETLSYEIKNYHPFLITDNICDMDDAMSAMDSYRAMEKKYGATPRMCGILYRITEKIKKYEAANQVRNYAPDFIDVPADVVETPAQVDIVELLKEGFEITTPNYFAIKINNANGCFEVMDSLRLPPIASFPTLAEAVNATRPDKPRAKKKPPN